MINDYESLKTILRDLALYSEYLSAVLSICFLYKYKNTILKYFALILVYTALNEIFGGYLQELVDSNKIIYNIYNFVIFTYFFWLYRASLSSKIYKNLITAFGLSYIIAFTINSFYQNYLIESQTVPYIIAGIFLIISIIFYFIEILKSEKVLNVNKNLLFWISVGLFLYHVGIIPFRIISNSYIYTQGYSDPFYIKFILVIIMNLCFIIGFVWSSNKKQEY